MENVWPAVWLFNLFFFSRLNYNIVEQVIHEKWMLNFHTKHTEDENLDSRKHKTAKFW